MTSDRTLHNRKEPRYQTCDDQSLHCETFIDYDDPIKGTVIDISSSGLRLLCRGDFVVGKAILTELKTDQLQGVFPGVIRRVEPWVDGQVVLGCQLLETVPDDLLDSLAHQAIIDRRRDARVGWKQPAKMSLELQPGEVDVEIQDCSLGGISISSQTAIPNNARARIRIEIGDQQHVIVDAKAVWQVEHDNGCSVGLAFTKREVPALITQVLANGGDCGDSALATYNGSSFRRNILVAVAVVLFGLAMTQTGL